MGIHINVDSSKDIAKLKGIKVGSLNIRSLYKKVDDVKLLLADSKLDYLGLSESWLNLSVIGPEVEIEKYNMYRFDRDAGSSKRGGGGIVVYINTKRNFEHLSDWDICTRDIECLWTKLNLKATRTTFIGCIYRPPEGNIDNFLSILENKILDIYELGIADLILLGDVNIDYMATRSGPCKKLNLSLKVLFSLK